MSDEAGIAVTLFRWVIGALLTCETDGEFCCRPERERVSIDLIPCNLLPGAVETSCSSARGALGADDGGCDARSAPVAQGLADKLGWSCLWVASAKGEAFRGS